MARQFREQLEEEVQLEEARKAQRASAAPPVEPAPAAEPPREGTGSEAPPRASPNGSGSPVTPDLSDAQHAQPSADPSAGQPA